MYRTTRRAPCSMVHNYCIVQHPARTKFLFLEHWFGTAHRCLESRPVEILDPLSGVGVGQHQERTVTEKHERSTARWTTSWHGSPGRL